MNTKSGTRKTYTKEQIESMKKSFKSSPKVEKVKDFKASDAIKEMAKEINAMQEKGYSLSMILEMLNKNGFEVSLATLKSGISQAKAKKESKPKENLVQKDLLSKSDSISNSSKEKTTTYFEQKTKLDDSVA